ncbi:MAG: HEPN domain-containing protein [Pseudomonadota bacterium]
MKDKTKTWLELAQNDLDFAKSIFDSKKRYCYVVHFCHQSLEKLLKAIIQEYSEETPKRTHNFKTLWEQAQIPLTERQKLQLLEIMPHYIGTKYPEDIRQLHKIYTKKYVEKLLINTMELFKWLKKYLQLKK